MKTRGYTLLEMLLVLAVLGVVVLASFSLSSSNAHAARFDQNLFRLQAVRTAILGDLQAQIEEHQLFTGFVADVGRLPDSVSELLNQGTLPSWSYNDSIDQWSGWRGPYLHTYTKQQDVFSFSDGWGNWGDTNNFGWNISVNHTNGTLILQSYGADNAEGGSGYDLDFPTDGFLVAPREALVDLLGWQVTVHLHNPVGGASGGASLPIADSTLRVRLHYPEDGSLTWPVSWPGTSPERDAAAYLTAAQTITAGSIADGESTSLVFDFGQQSKLVPFGVRTLSVVIDSTGQPAGDSSQPTWRVSLHSRMQPRPTSIAWNLE